MFNPKFTYIIPFKYTPDRMLNLRRVIDWLSGFQGSEILVIEQDKNSKIGHFNLKCKHILAESEAPFNKAWLYNIGLKAASSTTIIFGDADYIMDPYNLIESLKMLESCDCVVPTVNTRMLSQQESNLNINQIFKIDDNLKEKKNLSDGIIIFKREGIQKIGGWNEDFLGIGYYNEFQDMKIKNLLNFKKLNYTGYHYDHRPLTNDKSLIDRNEHIKKHFESESKELLQQHINMTIPKLGMRNKYQL